MGGLRRKRSPMGEARRIRASADGAYGAWEIREEYREERRPGVGYKGPIFVADKARNPSIGWADWLI